MRHATSAMRATTAAVAAVLCLAVSSVATAQTNTKIVTDAVANGQTGAIQTGSRASGVTFTFCGTGFSGDLYVDAAATSSALAQVWTTTLAANSDCTTVYSYSPASKWYRVRWTRSAGTLNVWLAITTGDVTPGAITGPVGGLTAGRVALSSGATGITDDAGLTYDAGTNALTVGGYVNSPIYVGPNGYGALRDTANAFQLDGAASIGWTAGGGYSGAKDSGLARTSAGLLKVTDGSSSLGSLEARNFTATALPAPGSITVAPVLTQVGTITVVAGSALVDGDGFVIKGPGGSILPLEFDLSPGDGTSGGAVPILFTAGDAVGTIRDNVILAINGAAALHVVATVGGAAVVNLAIDAPATAGDTNTEAVADAGFAVTGFANPTAATTWTYKLVARLASGATTEAGAASSTAAGVATLSASNFNRLTWSAVSGATDYQVYRTAVGTSPVTTGVIYTGSALTFDDTGIAGSGATAPSSNGTGVVTGARVLVGDGTITAPSVAFPGDPEIGLYRESAGRFGVKGILSARSVASGLVATMGTPGTAYLEVHATVPHLRIPLNGASLAIGSSNDTILTRGAAATWQLGAAAANSDGVDQTLQTQGGITGTDRAAGDLTIQTGVGTGTGASSIIFKAPTPQATGTTPQTHATVLTLKDSGTGGTSAPQAIFADGTAAAPSIRGSDSNSGLYFASSGKALEFTVDGAYTATRFNQFGVGVGSRLTLGTGENTYLTSPAAATVQMGLDASATPVAQTLQAQGGSGTDIAGANLTIQSGAGTGAGAGSTLTLKTPAGGGSGTGAQTQTTRLVIGEGGIDVYRNVYPQASDTYKMGSGSLAWTEVGVSRATLGSKQATLTESSADGFVEISVQSGATTSGEVIYEVIAADAGGEIQSLSGTVRYAAVNKAGTVTASLSEVGTQTSALTAGTLTATNTVVAGAGKITLACNAVSSLTQTVLVIRYRINSPATDAITPL